MCLYWNSSTLQIIHQVPRNQEKMPSKKLKITRSASNKLGSKSTSRHRLALSWPIGVVFGLSTFLSTLPRLVAVNELSALLSNVIFQLKLHWIISFLRFGGGNEKNTEIRAGSLSLRLLTRLLLTRLLPAGSLPFWIRSLSLARVLPNVNLLAGLDTKRCFWFRSETFYVRNKCFPVCAAQETWATMCPQQCVLVCQGLKSLLLNVVNE